MKDEIVKYNNYINALRFERFEQRDFDLLMAICSRMKELGDTVQTFGYDYLMELVNWDRAHAGYLDKFHDELRKMNERLIRISASVDLDDNRSTTFVLFTTFYRDKKKKELKVCVNKEFAYILNDLSKNFTQFELCEYVSLDGRYAKQLYQQLRQRYRMRGHFWQVDLDELRKVLSIPPRLKTKYITDDILKHCVSVIRSCKGFRELKYDVIRGTGRGRPITGYRFTWTEAKQIPGQMDIDDVSKEIAAYRKNKNDNKGKNKFHNFEEQEYDYDAIERALAKSMQKGE